jgi:hypothetical protein
MDVYSVVCWHAGNCCAAGYMAVPQEVERILFLLNKKHLRAGGVFVWMSSAI